MYYCIDSGSPHWFNHLTLFSSCHRRSVPRRHCFLIIFVWVEMLVDWFVVDSEKKCWRTCEQLCVRRWYRALAGLSVWLVAISCDPHLHLGEPNLLHFMCAQRTFFVFGLTTRPYGTLYVYLGTWVAISCLQYEPDGTTFFAVLPSVFWTSQTRLTFCVCAFWACNDPQVISSYSTVHLLLLGGVYDDVWTSGTSTECSAMTGPCVDAWSTVWQMTQGYFSQSLWGVETLGEMIMTS